MNKKQLIAFIYSGGTVLDLKNMLKPELWKPLEFSDWCLEHADSMTASQYTLNFHMRLMEASDDFKRDIQLTEAGLEF